MRRERDRRDLIKKARKSVVLFVDEAHDLHSRTLVGLKRLMEVIVDGGLLSIVLVSHPKLRNDLSRPTMEKIMAAEAIDLLAERPAADRAASYDRMSVLG